MTDSRSATSLDSRLAMAEAAIAALKDDYTEQLRTDVGRLSSIWAAGGSLDPDTEFMKELFSIAHNLKGQAGTFGYDLVTSVSASLCELLLDGPSGSEKRNAVGQHVSVLNSIVDKDIVGTGGDMGAKIIQALRSLSVDH